MITLPYDDEVDSSMPDASGGGYTGVSPQRSMLGPALTGLGAGVTAGSQFAAGADTASFLRANAAISEMQAKGENEAGAEQAELYRQHLRSRIGAQAASIGGANITTSGSALRGLEATSQLGAQDIAQIQLNAARKAWGFQVTQAGDLMRADMAQRGGITGGLGTLITSGARAYGNWQGS